MVSFMDILPDESKRNLSSVINLGDVLATELYPEEGVTPKGENQESRYKYFVVVGKTKDDNLIGFVLINSKINCKLRQELKDLHYPLPQSKYNFLDYNSHVYCGEIKEIEAKKLVSRSRFSGVGRIHDDDLELIKEAVMSSPIISKKKLKRYGLTSKDIA